MVNHAIIVDLETTGLDSSRDQIIEIGAIKFDLDTGYVIDQFQTFSLPEDDEFFDEFDDAGDLLIDIGDEINDEDHLKPFKLSPFIIKLTGITDQMLLGAPTNSDAVKAFFKFAGDLDIWAFNAGFDSKFLNCHTEVHRPLRDVLTLAKKAFPDLSNYKLSELTRHLNISVQGVPHRAITDCLMTKELLLRAIPLVVDKPHPFHPCFRVSDYLPKEGGVFYGKTIVFTGALVTMTRDGAATHASQFGFKIGSSVTKKTDYLVVGVQDLSTLAGHDKSTKQRKAEELVADGVKIEILTENDFVRICGINL